jgi:hypothetical protein
LARVTHRSSGEMPPSALLDPTGMLRMNRESILNLWPNFAAYPVWSDIWYMGAQDTPDLWYIQSEVVCAGM